MSNPADQSAADAAASQASTALRGSKTLEESVNHALSAINISKLSRETDQQSATSTPTDHAAKKRRVDSGGRVRVSLLEQIQIAEEKTRNAFARNRNSTQSPAQTPVQTHAPTPAPQAAPTASSVAPPAPTVGPTTTDAASAFTTASPQALMSTVATAPSVTSAAPPQTVLSPSPQLVTTDTIDHLPIPIPEPASNAASSDLTALTGTGISENQYGFGSTTGGVLDPALTYSFTQVAVPQQTGISQLNPNILSDVGVKLDPEPNTGQSFGLESAILPTNLKPSNGNNTQFKARSLPILENLATQILSLVSQSSFQDIAAIAAEPTSETAQAYSTMRSLFEHTRRLYSDSTFLSPFELGLFEQSQLEILRKANIATFVASIVGSQAIDFSGLNNRFLDIFAPDGNRLLKGQGALYLELKTQAFVSGLLSNVRSSDQLLNEFFPEDLEQHLLMRRQNMKQLAPSELDFVKRCQSRRDIILNEMRSANASNTLQERYQWGNFLKELCGFIGKNFEGLNHHKKQAKPQQGQQQQQIQEQQKSQLQQQQIQHTEQGINQPSQFAVTATTSIYPPPAPSSVNTGGLFDASTPAPTHNHYQQPSQQESPSYGFLQPSSTSPLSTSSTVTSAPVSASSPAIAPPFAPDPAPAPTSTPTQTAAKQSQESNQPSPSPGPSRSSFSSDLVARAARAAQIALQGQLIKSKQKPESPQMRTQPQPSPNLQTQAQQLPQEQQQQQQVNQTQQPQPQAPLPTQQVQQVQPQERLQQPQVPSPNRQQLLLPAQLNQPHQIIQHQPQPLPTQVQPPSQSQPQLQPQPFTQSQASSVQVNQSVQPASLPSRPFRLHVSQHFQVVTQQQLDQKFGVSSPSHAPSPAHDVHTPTSIAQPLPPQPQAVIQQPFSAQPPIPQQTPASRPQPVQIKFQHTPPLQFHQYTPPSSLASHSSASGQYQVQNSFTYAPGLPHYSQSQPTQVLYERARQAASARPAPSRRSILPSQRRPWTTEEENALMAGLDRVKGPHWAQILQMFGPGGTINETLKDRNQVQLKDKARNLKLFFLKSGIEVPYYLKFVTGELKTRAPAQAAKQEARERERQRGEEDQAHVEGVEGMMALSNRHSLNFTPGVKPPAPTQQAPITLPHGLPPVSQQVPPPQLQSQPQQYPSQTRTTYTQQVTDNIVAAPPQADTPTAEQVMKRALMQSIAADIKNEPIPYQPSSPSLAAQPQQQQQQQPLESSSTQDLASKPASEFSLQYPPEASAQSFQQTENNTDNNQIQRLLQSDQDQKLEQAVEITQLGQPQQPQQPEQLDAFQMVVHLQTHNEQHTQQQLNAQALNQPTLSPSSQAV